MSRAVAGRPGLRVRTAGAVVAAVGVTAAVAASPATAAGTARVNLVHGIPGVAVKVCVDGKAAADGFRYGDTITGARLAATTHKVRLVRAGQACAAPAILKSTFTPQAGRNYTVVANLNAGGTPNLKAFVNNVKPTAAGKARLAVRHTAQAPAVNVWGGSAKLVSGTSFTWGKSAAVAVPAGTYAAKVTLPGSKKPVIGPSSLTLRQGRAYQVYAVGSPGHYRLITVRVPVGTT